MIVSAKYPSDIECISDQVMLMKKGHLVAVGTPRQLIQSLHDKVAEIICSPEKMGSLQKLYKVGNIRQRSEGMALRIVGDDLPKEYERANYDIDLEDVYLYYNM